MTFDRDLDLCSCGGVEITGLHATMAPRRPGQQAPPVVEDYVFVPYVEDNVSLGNSELVDYCNICESFVQQSVLAILDNGLADVVRNKEFLRKCYGTGNIKCKQVDVSSLGSDQSATWINTLADVFSCNHSEDYLRNACNKLNDKSIFREDKLISNLLSGSHLKTCLDVVVENTRGNILKIAEINASSNQLFSRISRLLAKQPALTVDLCALDEQANMLEQSLVDEFDLSTAVWDLKGPPPSTLGTFDLVMASNLHEQKDLREALAALCSVMKDGSFALIHDITHHFGVVAASFALTRDLAEYKDLDSRTCGPYCDVSQWQQLIKSAGLEIVARKSDGLLGSLFLCRKISTVVCKPIVISVNDINCSWVDEVKAALSDDNALERVWLLAELSSLCGVIGLINCLRHESGGQKVRLDYKKFVFQITPCI